MKAALRGAGLRVYGFRPYAGAWSAQAVEDVLGNFGPYMMSVRFSAACMHWILIKGLDGTNVLYHDSWKGRNMAMSAAQLAAVSDGRDTDDALGATLVPVHAAGLSVQVAWF